VQNKVLVMSGLGIAFLLDACCASSRRTSSREGSFAPLEEPDVPCDHDAQNEGGDGGERSRAKNGDAPSVAAGVSTIFGDVEQGLKNLGSNGETSARARELNRSELAREHPDIPNSTLEEAWREAGVSGADRDREKEAAVNQSRAGRYKKKRFV